MEMQTKYWKNSQLSTEIKRNRFTAKPSQFKSFYFIFSKLWQTKDEKKLRKLSLDCDILSRDSTLKKVRCQYFSSRKKNVMGIRQNVTYLFSPEVRQQKI